MLFLLTLPFRLVGAALAVVAGVATLTRGTLRVVGYRRIAVLGTGVVVGLLLAPVPGEALRRRVREVIDQRAGRPQAGIEDQVRAALSSAPGTWHLPQPGVALVAGRIVLTGPVPHETGRLELVRVAAAVRGVAAVDDHLIVDDALG